MRRLHAPGLLSLIFAVACSAEPSDNVAPTGGSNASSGGSGSSSSGGSSGAGSSSSSSGSSSGGALDAGRSDATTPVGCYDYASFAPRAVRFSADVMPLFQARCARCHNDPAASAYYGANASLVYSKLLSGTPVQAPALKFVAPNDPLRSYMLAKVEYTNPGGTCSLVQCSAPGCNLYAPPGMMLPEAEKAILRSWIMTGAKND